ncbi:MAG: aminotransferase class V-fold PLP-dependent enzyme, partial [Thermoleophilia bacterium]|nr:aminotransferase class V-fold PLP-dependent enzyme [Thermoleophilia bacterium]
MTEAVKSAPAGLAQLVRGDFPILEEAKDGRRLIYLDSAATGQKPRQVIEAIDDFFRHSNAPIHRSTYDLAERSTALFEGARERIAAYMNATPETTVFTRNATEAINLVANAWGRDPNTGNLGAGDVVLVTQMEHHSNI